jgi:hypothetical protein
MRRSALNLILILLMLLSGAYGFAIGRYEVFPFEWLRTAWLGMKPTHAVDSPYARRERFERMPISADVVMLGDSHTSLMDWQDLIPGVAIANRGIAGDTVARMLERLGPIVAARSKKVLVMAGINDILAGSDVDEIATNYKQLITILSKAGSAVFVQSTLVTANAKLNAKVDELNNRLVAFCRELNCKYVDLNSRIAPDGILKDTPDGIHLGLSAYLIWSQVIHSEMTS